MKKWLMIIGGARGSKLLGDSTVTITQKYAHLGPD